MAVNKRRLAKAMGMVATLVGCILGVSVFFAVGIAYLGPGFFLVILVGAILGFGVKSAYDYLEEMGE